MDLYTIEKWQCGNSVEVFYNSSERHLIFKKFNFLYSKAVDNPKSQPYVDLGEFSSQFISCTFSPSGSILSFQRNTHDIVKTIQDFLALESKTHFVLNGKLKTILGYHWLSQTLYSDFVVIDSTGIEFFKVFPKLGKIMTVRNYPMSVGHYWFHSAEGILVVASSPPKLGLFSTFFINQSKGPKFFNGQRFNCDLSPSVTDKWTETIPHLNNLNGFIEPASFPNPHFVSLVSLYGATYFIHINCIHGSLTCYKLTHEKVQKVADSVQVPPGHYGIREVDNLLVLQNFSLQESYLIDIRSKKYGFSVFYTFWNGMSRKPEVTLSLKLIDSNGNLTLNSEVLYNGKSIERTDLSVSLRGSKVAAAECEFFLDSSKVFVDNDICVDVKEGRCFKLLLYPAFITENHPDQVESILFLLRRSNCKTLALGYLKRLFRNGVDLKIVTELFKVFASHYKLAAIEKRKSQSNVTQLKLTESGLGTLEGMTLLLQSEVLGSIFFPLFEENSLQTRRLAAYVQAYIVSLWNEDLQVQLNFQVLLLKLLIKAKEFQQIEQLVQHHVLPDSLEISSILLANVGHYEQFWYVAVDMLARLKANDKLVDVLIEKQFFFEGFKAIEAKSPVKFDATKVFNKGYHEVDENLINLINILIKEWNFLNSG